MNARIPVHIDTSPEGCAARQCRIEAAVAVSLKRGQQLRDARTLTREAGIQTPWELLAALTNLADSIKGRAALVDDYSAKLDELVIELADELNDEGPELAELPYSGRAEFDGQTVGVRHRSVA